MTHSARQLQVDERGHRGTRIIAAPVSSALSHVRALYDRRPSSISRRTTAWPTTRGTTGPTVRCRSTLAALRGEQRATGAGLANRQKHISGTRAQSSRESSSSRPSGTRKRGSRGRGARVGRGQRHQSRPNAHASSPRPRASARRVPPLRLRSLRDESAGLLGRTRRHAPAGTRPSLMPSPA
jgi:hypothetical protein